MNRIYRAAFTAAVFCMQHPARAAVAYTLGRLALRWTAQAVGHLLPWGGPEGSDEIDFDDAFGAPSSDSTPAVGGDAAASAPQTPSTALIDTLLQRPQRRGAVGQLRPGRKCQQTFRMGAGAMDVSFLCRMDAHGLYPVRTCSMGMKALEGGRKGRGKRVGFHDVSTVVFFTKGSAPSEAAPSPAAQRHFEANARLVQEERARVYWAELYEPHEKPQAAPALILASTPISESEPAPTTVPAPSPKPDEPTLVSVPVAVPVPEAAAPGPIPIAGAKQADGPVATVEATAHKLIKYTHVVYGLQLTSSSTGAWASASGKTAYKRFSEVHALHLALLKCPAAKAAAKSLAHVAPKKTCKWSALVTSDTRDATVGKRMLRFPAYLNAVLAHEELAAHPAVRSFFGIEAAAF